MDATEKKERRHPFKTIKYLLRGMLLCLAVGVGGFLGGRYLAAEPKSELSAVVLESRLNQISELSAVVLESRLNQISELASLTYSYTNMAQFENSDYFYGMTLPFTTKRFLLTYDGVIKAGIDMSAVRVESTAGKVQVRLPQAQILSREIDERSVEIFDEKTSIFNPFTVEDFTSFQTEQKKVMEEKALDRGLLEQAGEKAAESIYLLLAETLPEGTELIIS